MNLQLRNSFLLLICASIWGSAFVAQSVGMDHISPFAFTWARSWVGTLFLLAVIPVIDHFKGSCKPAFSEWRNPKVWIGGFWCGIALFVSESLQQFGLLYTSVGKAGFLTSLYIVFVPVAGLFIGKRTSPLVWLAVLLSAVGLYYLCMPADSFSIELGDSLVLTCAVTFTAHILIVDRYAPFVDCVRMSCVQFFTGSVLGFICMLIFAPPTLEDLMLAAPAFFYAGICSNGIAYTLQIIGQKDLHPTLAAIIMSLESVMSVIFGWLLLSETMSEREIFGCALMFTAVILSQLPSTLINRFFAKFSR